MYKYLHYSGWVAEWLKAHAWKVCLGLKPNGGSNPLPSAIKQILPFQGGIVLFVVERDENIRLSRQGSEV